MNSDDEKPVYASRRASAAPEKRSPPQDPHQQVWSAASHAGDVGSGRLTSRHPARRACESPRRRRHQHRRGVSRRLPAIYNYSVHDRTTHAATNENAADRNVSITQSR